MAKIKFNSWADKVTISKHGFGYRIMGLKWWKASSTHGRSKGIVICPCCNAEVEVYIWSFIGGGKRCTGCNVLLGSQGAWISDKELSEEVSVTENSIIKNKK